MKSNSTNIYHLIHSLTASEKRYFKLFAQRHKISDANNYYVLYQQILKKKLSSDQETINKLAHSTFIKYLPVAKIQLFNNILKSLENFNKPSSKKEQIKSLNHQTEILLNKGFLKDAKKLIVKAKKMAIQFEYFELLNETFSLEEKYYAKENYRQISFQELEIFHKEKIHSLKLQTNHLEYWNLFSLIYKYHFQKIKSKKQADQNQLQKWFGHELLKDEKNALSINTKVMFYQLKALEAFINNETENALKINKKILQLFEENPKIKEVNAKKYLSIFNNYLIDCLQAEKEEELKTGLQKLRSLPKDIAYKKFPETAMQVFTFSYQVEFNKNISKGDFLENTELVKDVENQFLNFGNKLSPHTKITFYYLFLYSFFGANQFEESIDYSNLILDNFKSNVLEELQISTRLILLLAHYEIGNEELLEYTIVNTRRYHLRRKKLYKLEATILSAISALVKANKNKREKIYLKLKNDLEQIKLENKENNIFNNFNYLAWVNSKIEKVSFEEAFKKLIK